MSEQTGQGPDTAVVEALLGGVTARYGDRLSPEDRTNVMEDMHQLVTAIQTLRAYRLTNADEPDFVFRPYRRES